MYRQFTVLFLLFLTTKSFSQLCRFETSNGLESATYFEAIDWYRSLDKASPKILVKEMGPTDADYPLHLVLVSSDGRFDPALWHRQQKVMVLINNGIHPGEPDGIDASMMLVRDIANGKVQLPANVVLAFIPVYNIGGCLNRNSSSRANQNGPLEYGFRGNAQNLDLNRDFTKCDSREARSFAQLFHWLQPDILIDNHVSDGADYQHTMTMLTTQYDKLGADLGYWLRDVFEPQLYAGMKAKSWPMCPYVNFETTDITKGMEQFYDPPRYSSGYAALFQTIGFVPETHMLKPFADRVKATYAFMQTIVEKVSVHSADLLAKRRKVRQEVLKEKSFPLHWTTDTTQYAMIPFMGYESGYKPSEVSGQQRLYYDRQRPFTKEVRFYNHFEPKQFIKKPLAYIIPQGWHNVINLLQLNGVQLNRLSKDSLLNVETYRIEEYKSYPRPYEKHHKNYGVKTTVLQQSVRLLQGDYIIPMNQLANRYIMEMLEPTGDDSFFAWNFFDAILQQKEGYSDYRWEDLAATILKDDPALKARLEEKKKTDTAFAANASAQLEFVYKNSKYYEPVHLRYPVYRLVKQ